MATFADVDAFFAKWNGKSVDRDGAYGAQCVDFAAQYTAELFGVGYLPTPVTGGARDIYERFSLGGQFDLIKNTPDYVPRKGDVVVWTGMPNNQFGHIAIATGEGDVNWFTSYDQNWNAQRVEKIKHNYNYVLGALRPKNLTSNEGVIMNTNDGKELYLTGLHRPAESDAAASQWNGRTPASALNVLRTTPEWQATDAKVKGYDALAKQVADLSARPTKEQLQAVVDQFNASKAKVAELEAKIKDNPDTQLLDEGGSWLSRIIKRLFGGK